MASLLGQFFPLIKGSQEDIASKGLTYLLEISKSVREAISNFLFTKTNIKFDNIKYIAQSIGQNLERPDISGLNDEGKEVIIIEAKFWATLTKNQPNEYLNRLNKNSVLLFICPALREISLIEEIEARIKSNNIEYQLSNKTFCLKNNKFIIISDWNSILNLTKQALIQNNENTSDIDQIIGFCEVIDNNTFLPIKDEELSPSIARRINSYCDLLDKVIDNLKLNLDISLDGMKSTPQKYGYTRYFKYKGFGNALDLNFKNWENVSDTPFWLSIKNMYEKSWNQSNDLKNKLKTISIKTNIRIFDINNDLCFAIIPKINIVEDEVIKYFTEDIISIFNEL